MTEAGPVLLNADGLGVIQSRSALYVFIRSRAPHSLESAMKPSRDSTEKFALVGVTQMSVGTPCSALVQFACLAMSNSRIPRLGVDFSMGESRLITMAANSGILSAKCILRNRVVSPDVISIGLMSAATRLSIINGSSDAFGLSYGIDRLISTEDN